MSQVVLITGVGGQDGSYLAEFMAARGARIIGTTRDMRKLRRPAAGLPPAVELVEWDLIDKQRFSDLLDAFRPNEIYNLAAFSSGEHMDRNPDAVADINGVAVVRMLEAIRLSGAPIRFCQASSSEVFAGSGVSPQSETTPRVPRSVYGAAKIFADSMIRLYREKHGLFCCAAMLFNHESPRRGEGFVTQKVVRAAVEIKAGRRKRLSLGNLDAARDWGFAGDYVRAMALMLQAAAPADYVVATGTAHTVAELCERAFGALSLDYRDYVDVDPSFVRPPEAALIVGDAARARAELGWVPSMSFADLISMMVAGELGSAPHLADAVRRNST